jgi:acetolactate synthase-1/2/3 large subunit
MGYGVPAAVAAKIAAPHRTVLNFAGDGDFMMNGQELATAVQHRAGVLFIVFNNGAYGTIRMHQEREYPGRVSGTALQNPDFAALAQAYGAFGESVETTARFPLALERAQRHIAASGLPALIELRYDAATEQPAQPQYGGEGDAEERLVGALSGEEINPAARLNRANRANLNMGSSRMNPEEGRYRSVDHKELRADRCA